MEIFFYKNIKDWRIFNPLYSIAANTLNLVEFVQQTFWGSYIALNFVEPVVGTSLRINATNTVHRLNFLNVFHYEKTKCHQSDR